MATGYSSLPSAAIQIQTISYRNGVYQGAFDNKSQLRQNFGLIFTTDNHMIMGSTWLNDKANQATFIYYSHAHYIYGFWNDGILHGFNAARFDKVVIFAWYERGVIKGRVLAIYEQYNTAIVIQVGQNQDGFQQVHKGDIYSDEQFNQYIRMCNWPQFQQNWKTLIKFMSANLVFQNQPKSTTPKLRLVNQAYYRYGYDEGIAVVFDDEYKINSIGLHKKANLKSLGVKFTKQNFVEEGNFNALNQIYAFNYGHRPEAKIGKIYNNYLLKSLQFVNKYLTNPAKLLINYLQNLIKSNVFRKMLAGQITTRKIDLSYQSPEKGKAQSNRLQSKRKRNQSDPRNKTQEAQKLKQQKARLQSFKKQIYDSIGKKSKRDQNYKQLFPQENENQQKIVPVPILRKPPVQLATRTSHYHQKLQKSKNRASRSPIFTPDKNQSRSVSPSDLSPFQQKMRSKIFKNQLGSTKSNKYTYVPIDEDLYPKHNQANAKKYNSPHEELNFSMSRSNNINEQVFPVSVRNQQVNKTKQIIKPDKRKQREIYLQQNAKNDIKPTQSKEQEQAQKPKKIIRNSEKNDQTISFRDNYRQNQSKRQYTETNVPNIVISSPFKNKSPIKKMDTTDILRQQGMNKRNNVYFKQSAEVPELSPNQKPKKQIKGSTYLQKYQKTKQLTPQKKQADKSSPKKYNKTIKGFNNNNRIYEKIQSPQKMSPQKRVNKAYIQQINSAKQTRQFLADSGSQKRKYQYVFN